MVLFKKKTTLTKDTMVSEYMPDTYDGKNTTAKIIGGFKSKKYLYNVTIPSKPDFGDATLKELETHLYVDSITIGDNVGKYPEFTSYLLTEDTTIEEGKMKPVEDEDIVVFSGGVTGYPTISDDFNGLANAGPDANTFIQKGITSIGPVGFYFATVDTVSKEGVSRYGFRKGRTLNVSKNKLKRDHGFTAAELGLKNYDNNSRSKSFIKLGESEDRLTTSKKYRQILANDAHPGVSREIYMKEDYWLTDETVTTTEPSEEEIALQATPSNTIFEIVKGAETFMGKNGGSKDDPEVIVAEGNVKFNTKNFLTQGQSLSMKTFWTAGADKDVPTYPVKMITGYENNAANPQGANKRQETCLVKKNIPFPPRLPVNPSADHRTNNTFSVAQHGSTIELDINIQKMSKAYQYATRSENHRANGTSDDSRATEDNFITLHRGFHIVFADTPPLQDETLFDYVLRLKGGSTIGGGVDTAHYLDAYKRDAVDFHGGSITDDADAAATMYAARCGDQEHVYAGVSFVNINSGVNSDIDEGIVALPWNGVKGSTETTTWDRGSSGLYISDHEMAYDASTPLSILGFFAGNKNGGSDATSTEAERGVFGNQFVDSSNKHILPLENSWTRLSFVVSPESSYRADGDASDNDAGQASTQINMGSGLDTTTTTITVDSASAFPDRGVIAIADGSGGTEYVSYTNKPDGVTFAGCIRGYGAFATHSTALSHPDNAAVTDVTGAMGHFSFGRLYISDIKDGFTHQTYGTSTVKRYLDIGLIGDHGGFKSYNDSFSDITGTADDVDNWPQNMSIWVTNHPNEFVLADFTSSTGAVNRDVAMGAADKDTGVEVLIDAIRFKDFNFEAKNATQIPENYPNRQIAVGAGSAMLNASIGDNDSDFTEFITSRKDSTPSIMTLGLSQQSYLGANGVSGSNKDYAWTRWPYAFWFNNFRCDNLKQLGEIPSTQIAMIQSVPFHGSSSGDEIELGATFSQDSIDDSQTTGGTTDFAGGGNNTSSTQYIPTDLVVNAHDGDVLSAGTASQVTTVANSDNSAANIPVRVGDVIRFKDNENGDKTVTSVAGSISSGLTIGLSGTMSTSTSGEHILVKKENMVDQFSQKGGLMSWKLATGTYAAIQRENLFCSARITEIIERRGNLITLQVDTLEPFKLKADEEYIFYLYGTKATYNHASTPTGIATNSANAATGIKVVDIDDTQKQVTFAWNGKDNAGTSILKYSNLYKLYVSPYKFWLSIVTNMKDSNGLALPARYYDNVILLNNNWTDNSSIQRSFDGEGLSTSITNDFVDTAITNRRGVGTSYNEFLFNDSTSAGVPGAYINKWDLAPAKEETFLNLQDYGFGDYDEETGKGGNTSQTIMIDSKYNILRKPEIISKAGLKPSDNITMLVDFKEPSMNHEITIQTRENSSNPPKFVAVFEDEKPKNPSLTVEPNEDDPFFPEFKWSTSDTDLWYGLLHVTNEPQIKNQYDGAVAHIPLNEDTSTYTGVYLTDENGSSYAATAGEFINRLDGLAGFTKEFDGTNDYLTFADFTAPSDEMTIIAHITPDNSSGTRTILSKWNDGSDTLNDYELELNPNHQVKFSCLANGGSAMTGITGPVIPTDGETPTVVMATVDTNAARANLKLYYNGKLVEQSQAASSGASTSSEWEGGGTISGSDADIEDDSGILYVGANANASGTRADFFNGKIEEIVIYNRIVYPVVPTKGSYILDRPLFETDANSTSPVERTARLFIKDYHNIRGKTTEEVAASSQISYQKAAFRIS
tara:strand:+ start:87 stop:5360 length:5274 start_codon:yes stop_codon:yes gene_type:complete